MQVHRAIRQANTRVEFKVVYPDNGGKYVSHHIGSVSIGRRVQDDVSRRTLHHIKFKVTACSPSLHACIRFPWFVHSVLHLHLGSRLTGSACFMFPEQTGDFIAVAIFPAKSGYRKATEAAAADEAAPVE